MKKFLSIATALICIFGFCACDKKPTEPTLPEKPDENPPGSVENVVDDMERDYVYMWNQSGVGGTDKILKIQTENYALTGDAQSGAITSVGAYVSSADGKYAAADFSKLLKVSSMKYSVGFDGGEITFNRHQGYQRVIESGRYLQRADYNSLLNSADKRWTGRMELAATSSYIAVNYEVHNGSDSKQTLALSFTMTFESNLSSAATADGRGLTLRNSDGQGITVLRASDDELTEISFENGVLTVSNNKVEVVSGTFGGFGIIMIPSGDAKPSDVSTIENIENCTVTAEDISSAAQIPVTYDARRGIYVLDISGVNGALQNTSVGRNTYDRVKFSVKNNSGSAVSAPLSFQKTRNMSVTGISPMIRDAATLEPTGIQVQISKNWHSNPNASVPQNDPSRYLEGSWYHGTTCIPVSGNSAATYEYTCAYGEWGGVYAASHGQLCLIGWGGANNLLWEESAMGSWGESVTYDPDMGLGRSMIDDVRPFLVTSEAHGGNQFGWSGNVGGANFLDYYPTARQSKIVGLIPTYRAQSPCVTDINYNGVTADGAIAADITINMGRTDDVVRTYYTIKYTFLKDTEPDRLSFFKLCADGYADNHFRKYAIGDESGVLQNDVSASTVSLGYNGSATDAVRDDFWFMLYDSSNRSEENGDVAFIVREYAADLNGNKYSKPSYRIFGTENGVPQPSCELTLPAGVNKISAGSTVELKIEYLVLPDEESSYYGQSDYLLESKLFGTAAAVYEQAVGGKTVADVSVGTLTGTYPVSIRGTDGNVAAMFKLTGGLGYVPVKISNIPSYSGYRLQKLVSGSWQNVSQVGSANNRNDFWQVRYDAASKTYEFAFNIKNTSGMDYGMTEEYRLVKAEADLQ